MQKEGAHPFAPRGDVKIGLAELEVSKPTYHRRVILGWCCFSVVGRGWLWAMPTFVLVAWPARVPEACDHGTVIVAAVHGAFRSHLDVVEGRTKKPGKEVGNDLRSWWPGRAR